MSEYLKGTETLAWIRLQSDDYIVVVSNQLDVGFSENSGSPSMMESDGTAHTLKANYDLTDFTDNYIIRNRDAYVLIRVEQIRYFLLIH